MIIKKADKADTPVILEILRNSFADVAKKFNLTVDNCPKNLAFCTEQRIRDDIARGLQYYILEDNGRACGCVALEKANTVTCYLGRLAVLPELRNKGLGKTLVNHLFETAKKMGLQRVEIGIIAEHIELKSWYEKFGFVQKNIKDFDHLPFTVAFMAVEL